MMKSAILSALLLTAATLTVAPAAQAGGLELAYPELSSLYGTVSAEQFATVIIQQNNLYGANASCEQVHFEESDTQGLSRAFHEIPMDNVYEPVWVALALANADDIEPAFSVGEGVQLALWRDPQYPELSYQMLCKVAFSQ